MPKVAPKLAAHCPPHEKVVEEVAQLLHVLQIVWKPHHEIANGAAIHVKWLSQKVWCIELLQRHDHQAKVDDGDLQNNACAAFSPKDSSWSQSSLVCGQAHLLWCEVERHTCQWWSHRPFVWPATVELWGVPMTWHLWAVPAKRLCWHHLVLLQVEVITPNAEDLLLLRPKQRHSHAWSWTNSWGDWR